MEPITALAPAKINLTLHVTGRRADGYHLLDSIIVFADVGDIIAVRPAEALSLKISGPYAAALQNTDVENNSILRAARMLQKCFGIMQGAAISLEKNLPVAAGIGGGSSDAATALKLLTTLWNVPRDTSALKTKILELGADVPACFYGRPCHVTGIGDSITPLTTFPTLPVVLVNPGIEVSTAAVFSMGVPSRTGAPRVEGDTLHSRTDWINLLKAQRNDLQPNAVTLAPGITEVLAALSAQQGCLMARMSGSGATCGGIFDTKEHAIGAAKKLQAEHTHWWIQVSRLLGSGNTI